MHRTELHKEFKCVGPAILPVIHVLSHEQALGNAVIAVEESAQGVFLINHDFPERDLLPIIEQVRGDLPDLWIGVNFLGVTGRDAFPLLAELEAKGARVDAYWADNARIDEQADEQTEADDIAAVRAACDWDGLYFGGTAFKKQRDVAPQDYARSAAIAARYMDVVTTSGVATGEEAEHGKIAAFVEGLGGQALGLASGITPENVGSYAPHVDAMLVATGINHQGDFYNIDPVRLRRLIRTARRAGVQTTGGRHVS